MDTTEAKLAKAALMIASELRRDRWIVWAIAAFLLWQLWGRHVVVDETRDDYGGIACMVMVGLCGSVAKALQVLELLMRDRARRGSQEAVANEAAKRV
jgi:hypothetical protein